MIMSGYSIVIIAKSSRDVNMEDIIMAEKTNANIGFEKPVFYGDTFRQRSIEK